MDETRPPAGSSLAGDRAAHVATTPLRGGAPGRGAAHELHPQPLTGRRGLPGLPGISGHTKARPGKPAQEESHA